MQFTFKNFAKAGSGTMRINDLTIICGPNNSGKTYLNYAVHTILGNFTDLFDFGFGEDDVELKEQIQLLSDNAEVRIDLSKTLLALLSIKSDGFSNFGKNIHKYFKVPKDNFHDTEISLVLEEVDINKKISETGILVKNRVQYQYEFYDGKIILKLYKEDKEYENKGMVFKYFDNPNNIDFIVYEIKKMIVKKHFEDIIPLPFGITAERTGVSLFYKSFDAKNSSLINGEASLNSETENMKSRLAQPIELNINAIRSYEFVLDRKSFIVRENIKPVKELLSKLLDHGTYSLKDETLFFEPSKELQKEEPVVPIYATSSSIKSFFLLNGFIMHSAERNRILVIDEPELNLYIDKQVMFARLIARLVNSGVKVLVTTHSDYFIREINNLITMNSIRDDHKEKMMKEFDILDCDILDQSRVSAYKTDLEENIRELKTSGVGIDPRDWNKLINRENYKFDKIHFAPKKSTEGA